MSRRHAPFHIAACLCLMLLSAGQAWGWGKDGHRIVGRLAEAELSPVAQTEVARLLAGEPEPSLEGVSTWADQIRDLPEGRGTGRWHWLNLPKESPCSFVEERDCKDGNCVVGAIRAQLTLLADRSKPDTERRDALKFLVHFVGDVHQPFHAGFGFDRGGNDTQVRWLQRGTNLHALWDTPMVIQAGLEPDAYAAQLQGGPALPHDRTIGLSRPEVAWALESCRVITENGLYPERRLIPRSYMEQHRPLAETRLRQAGQRLARLINEALESDVRARNPR
jgi:hypothetical protein